MTEKLKQIIKDEVTKLPKETADAINAFDWVSKTEEIGKEFLFSASELNNFQAVTLLVLVGIIYPESYAQYIEDEVGTGAKEAEKIADEAGEQIFKPIQKNIEENVKKNMSGKNLDLTQNVDFIISGGSYASLLGNKK